MTTELEIETAKQEAITAVTDLVIKCKDKDEDTIRMIVEIFISYMINKAKKAGMI